MADGGNFDRNLRYSIFGLSSADGTTPIGLWVDPSTHELLVQITGDTITATPEKASSSAVTRVATSTTSATLLASNSSRKKAVIVNDATTNLYVKFGTTATATSFAYLLQPNDTLEEYTYTGRIDGILASSTGSAEVNEM